MAIGTLAALAIGGAALGSAVLGSSAANKATKAAKAGAADSTAVQREQLAAAQTALNPYNQAGLPASYALNSFLGLTPTQSGPAPQPNALAQFQPNAGAQFGPEQYGGDYNYPSDIGGGFGIPQNWQFGDGSGIGRFGGGAQPNGTMSFSGQPPVNGRDAFKTFLDNSDYGFQFMEGADRFNSAYAGNGVLQSGAAVKAGKEFEQNLKQGYRGEFLNALGNQQGIGVTAGSALAGVGQNFANSITGINSGKADAIGNAALFKANNVSNILGGITSAVGYGLGR